MSRTEKKTCKMKACAAVCRGGGLAVLALVFLLPALSGCAGPNGSARGTHKGGVAHTDIFRIPLPP